MKGYKEEKEGVQGIDWGLYECRTKGREGLEGKEGIRRAQVYASLHPLLPSLFFHSFLPLSFLSLLISFLPYFILSCLFPTSYLPSSLPSFALSVPFYFTHIPLPQKKSGGRKRYSERLKADGKKKKKRKKTWCVLQGRGGTQMN